MWIHHLLYKLNKSKRKIKDVFEGIKDFFEYAAEDCFFTLIILSGGMVCVGLLILLLFM